MTTPAEPDANPFASPTARAADPTDAEPLPTGERGPVPASVVVALVAIGVWLSFTALAILGDVMVEGEVPYGRALSFLVGVVAMWGLARGHRLAHQWSRILSCLGGVLFILALVGAAGTTAAMLLRPEGTDIAFEEFEGFNPATALWIGLTTFVILAILAWTTFFSLGTRSARRYFRLVCPHCGHRKVKAADFFFNRARCKRCTATW